MRPRAVRERCGGGGCECPRTRAATLVIAGSCFGSTWLGQLLDSHTCAVGFIDHGASPWADGKFRAPLSRLVSDLSFKARGLAGVANCSARGLVIAPDFARRIGLSGDANRTAPSGDANRTAPPARASEEMQRLRALAPRVIALTREPFYIALSRVKKRALAESVRGNCSNINQRGRPGLCDGVTRETLFAVDPPTLDQAVARSALDVSDVLATARDIATILHPESSLSTVLSTVRYDEMLAARALPARVESFVGLGSDATCAAARRAEVSATKSSPDEPLAAVENLPQLRAWAQEHAASWLHHLAGADPGG